MRRCGSADVLRPGRTGGQRQEVIKQEEEKHLPHLCIACLDSFVRGFKERIRERWRGNAEMPKQRKPIVGASTRRTVTLFSTVPSENSSE